jgi:signal transduction histidine kinase
VTAPAAASGWADAVLDDPGYLRLVRWVFHARLLCLLLATPATLAGPSPAPTAALTLLMLAVASLLFGLGNRQIRVLIQHPLLGMVDIALTLGLLVSVDSAQPAALTVVCSALLTGLLFPRRFLVVLTATLAVGSLGAPRTLLGTLPETWTGWLALIAGTPALVVSFVVIGVLVRAAVVSAVEARREVAEAVAAVGAADERARLARDMHDSVGKSLHGISLAASALRRTVDDDPVAARALAGELASASQVAAQEARQLLVGLRQGQLDRPTVDVVREILDTWSAAAGVATRLSVVRGVDADPAVTVQLAAALREMLHNIDKHAEATRVEVELTADAEGLELVVRDDGVGFEPSHARRNEAQGHFGLRGLHERAAQVGGTMTIDSDKGEGTTIRWTARRQPIPA